MVPFRIAFHDEEVNEDMYMWIQFWTFTDVVADVIFVIDVMLNALVFAYRTKGTLCTSTRLIFRRYLTMRGKIDVLTLLPLDRCAPASSFTPLWRCNKVSRGLSVGACVWFSPL